jgi:thioredoxin reductase
MYDVIIIGGSSAGLSAALQLGRAMRNVIVFDDGKPCNRFSHASHGFLTRDGIQPSELVRLSREQLTPYETVQLKQATIMTIGPIEGGFEAITTDGDSYTARKILLATGVKDTLPLLKNIEHFWGRSIFHCPYCDGWEVRNKHFVIYGSSEFMFHQVEIVQHWASKITLVVDPAMVIPQEKRDLYARHHIEIIEKPVTSLEGENGQIQRICFADGSEMACETMFIVPHTAPRLPFAEMLGCDQTPHQRLVVDIQGRTTVPGVYAAGDIATMGRSVAMAAAQGNMAGAAINADLIKEEFI